MNIPIPVKPGKGTVREVTIGSGEAACSTGGASGLPFLSFEGNTPHPPRLALEIPDSPPGDWPEELRRVHAGYYDDPAAWAEAAIKTHGADLLCVNLRSSHPDRGDRSPEEAVALVQSITERVIAPLIIQGPGPSDKQNQVLGAIAEATRGAVHAFASVVDDNYKTLAAACLAAGHVLVAETPIDVNLAKQLNILLSDISFPAERILIDPMTGGLGYGLEYTYSVMERIRLAALGGDAALAMPFLCFTGQECWKVKEVKTPTAEKPEWGDAAERGISWETTTALALILAGADIVVLRHPESLRRVRTQVQGLMTATGKE